MLRRNLIKSSIALPIFAAGCANTPALISDAQLIVNKFQTFLPLLAAIPGVPDADLAQINLVSSDIATAIGLASTLYPTIAPSAANTTIQNIEKAVEGALSIATVPPVSTIIAGATASVPGLADLSIVLQAADAILPALFVAFGLSAPASAASTTMTVTQARDILAE